jgi:peptide/nickel transport system ATP-binding protein
VNEYLLEADGLEVVYHMGRQAFPAVHDLSFCIRPGEILGIVGESGCGKSTLASAVLRLLPPNGEITAGRLLFKGKDLSQLSERALRDLRGRDIAMIFQDPLTSLNPTFTVGTQMVDAQKAHPRREGSGRSAMRRRAVKMLEQVGIPDAAERLDRFAHQFSGGMRQRIMIAMALMLEPGLLIADEPTSALDVTLEAQIVELLKRLRSEHGTAILFISHDLGVIAQICDRVVVMYSGRAVEEGDVLSLFAQPLHPYTHALLASVPSRKQRGGRLATIPGRVPSLSALPKGCKFIDRCPYAQEVSREREPRYLHIDGRRVRCDMYDEESGWNPDAGPSLESRKAVV